MFGCEVYVHVPKDERKKLYYKAKKCILLGYGTETTVFHSRDVKFNESSRGTEVSKEQEPKQNRYVELDHFSANEEPTVDEKPAVLRRSERGRKQSDCMLWW